MISKSSWEVQIELQDILGRFFFSPWLPWILAVACALARSCSMQDLVP